MTGGIDVLADMLEQVSLSERIVSEGTQLIEYAVRDAAWQLRHNIQSGGFPSILLRIAETLCQEDSEQTIRMAMAIILNALIFHTAIAGEHEVKEPKEARGLGGYLSKSKMQECWEGILKINYWPIFKIAHDLLGCIPERYTRMYLVRLVETAEAVANIGATTLNDLSGIMFQRLINDRKFLATFYTLPSSAHFAAELAVSQLDVDWADLEAIQQLRVADFACGTGTLLSAVYHRIAVRYRRRGGDDGLLHAKMVEQVLFGADIMPAATHLTTSVIASHHPTITFGKTQVFTMPYGMQPENTGLPHAIGSLDLLSDDPIKPLYSTGAEQLHGGGAELKNVVDVKAPNNSFDIVIMNPPFTRPTNHESTTIPVPSFAGFATTGDEQRIMSATLGKYRNKLECPVGNGNAGLASHFVDLAHSKLKPGGVAAFILPASFVSGASWKNARKILEKHYSGITVVSIADTGATLRAFSADTGMAEVVVVARKKTSIDCAMMVSLRQRPRSILEAVTVADLISKQSFSKFTRSTDSGSGHLHLTEKDRAGVYVQTELEHGGASGILETDLVSAMLSLRSGLKLPQRMDPLPIPITSLALIGQRGLVHRDINGRYPDGSPRGPFEIEPWHGVPTYPALWHHNAKEETKLIVGPDSRAEPRLGCEERANRVWQESAGTLHFNQDFRINSQPLTACLTKRPTLGGPAWPNYRLYQESWIAPVMLWANTTLGLMTFWWLGTRQQLGRARLTISNLPSLLVIDPRELSKSQLKRAKSILSDLSEIDFLPANQAWMDQSRYQLDKAVLVDLLGLSSDVMSDLEVLRNQWCAEPSVHGGKSTKLDIS